MTTRLQPKLISFDCFGTLVDWQRGLEDALREHAGIANASQARRIFMARIDAEWELIEELEEFRPYRAILAESLVVAARREGTMLGSGQAERVAATITEWPPFDDVKEYLPKLALHLPLAVVSNCDRADLDRVLARLGAPFAHSISADHVMAYKPEPDHLLALLHETELDEEEVLHVSAHADYDLATAQDIGVPAVYLDRRREALPDDIDVALRVDSLEALFRRLTGRTRRRSAR